jgi:hypothetical protein
MIQAARSSNSQSLLREAESLKLLINSEAHENFFNDRLDEVVEKRRNPDRVYTGAKALREDLLAYLEQQGEVKTANVWCRKLQFFKAEELLINIKNTLKDNGIQGVVELHLQDREINSPHIQFVGNDVHKAEELIANEVMKMNFEDSFESAVSRGNAPAFYEDKSIRVLKYDDRKRDVEKVEKVEKEIKERKEHLKEQLDNLKNKRDEFLKILGIKKDKPNERVENILDIKIERRNKIEDIINTDIDNLLEKWKIKSKNRSTR